MVRLRVRPGAADAAGEALQLSRHALQWSGEDPVACWLGPDQWLLTSDNQQAEDIVGHIDAALSGQLYAATDISSHYVCMSLKGPAARTVLAMGSGIDMRRSAFRMGQCVRTLFANVQLVIVAVESSKFDLYVDRSHANYLREWFASSSDDPMTRDGKFYEMDVS